MAEQGQGTASAELGSNSGSDFDKIFDLSKSLLFSVSLGPVLRVVVKFMSKALDSPQDCWRNSSYDCRLVAGPFMVTANTDPGEQSHRNPWVQTLCHPPHLTNEESEPR